MKRESVVCTAALAALVGAFLPGCGTADAVAPPSRDAVTRPAGWTEETHGDGVDADYDAAFPQDEVKRVVISIAAEDWAAMQSNLTELLGPRGVERPGRPMAPGMPGWIDMTPVNPMWVPATVECDGLTWTNVGLRYKGNSSLRSGWNSGSLKLPLKLDFDEYEDEHPEIGNQRFYGFKQLSLSNAFRDGTYMRDALAVDIFREADLPAAETAFYEVAIDYGDGPVDLGLYVVIEVVDDTVIDRFYGGDAGNTYEADGRGASLAQGTADLIRTSFLKENNERVADWSDIEELYAVLHAELRTSNPTAWRAKLESVLNVDGFLEWLALSAMMQHWDTYGQMSHNFYLYHDPDTGLLQWISWDHNQVLAGGGMGGPSTPPAPNATRLPGGPGRTVTLDREEIGAGWPLIRYLLDDPVYHDRYVDYIARSLTSAFSPAALEQQVRGMARVIAPYATQEHGSAAFDTAVEELIERIYERHEAAAVFAAAAGGA